MGDVLLDRLILFSVVMWVVTSQLRGTRGLRMLNSAVCEDPAAAVDD